MERGNGDSKVNTSFMLTRKFPLRNTTVARAAQQKTLRSLHQGRFPFVRTGRSDHPVRKWNASVLKTERTGSARTELALSFE